HGAGRRRFPGLAEQQPGRRGRDLVGVSLAVGHRPPDPGPGADGPVGGVARAHPADRGQPPRPPRAQRRRGVAEPRALHLGGPVARGVRGGVPADAGARRRLLLRVPPRAAPGAVPVPDHPPHPPPRVRAGAARLHLRAPAGVGPGRDRHRDRAFGHAPLAGPDPHPAVPRVQPVPQRPGADHPLRVAVRRAPPPQGAGADGAPRPAPRQAAGELRVHAPPLGHAVPHPAAGLARGRMLSPVLLLGAGSGEATCGILYLASYLRRHGVEAYVQLDDDGGTERRLEALMARVRPKLVGISLKWFHHVAGARRLARAVRKIDPGARIVLGGNSATFWWRDLVQWDCVDFVALGDGEVPLRSLCRGDPSPPNVVTRDAPHDSGGAPALSYVQGADSRDVFYSHFDELFLSQLDLHSFSGWVAPGKGCSENCLYCSGTRGLQNATFGRADPFLRPEECVRADHREIVPRTWQLRYDFAGSTAAFLERTWEGVDLTRHSTTYFLWGVPPPELAETLSRRFQRAY